MDVPGSGEEESEFTLLSREELEARVRERTAYLENLMDTMVDVLLVLDPEGRIELTNDALTAVLGYDEEDVVGKPIDVIFAEPTTNESLSEVLTEGAFVERLLTDGFVTDLEVYFETVDGSVVPTSISASVMRDDDGAVTGIVCVAKDISERTEAEETAAFLHSLLRHDLGNKLQVMKGYLELMREDGPGSTEEHLDAALDGVAEAVELIENVETLHRVQGEDTLGPVSLDNVLAETVKRHEDLRSRQGTTIENRVDGGFNVRAGRLLKELFSNLLENGLVHSGGSRIEISAREDDGTVFVTVEDDGEGIPEEIRDGLFEKGVTGPRSSGSGLGMHLVARIAETYEGDVVIGESELGGARFVVHLPSADAD